MRCFTLLMLIGILSGCVDESATQANVLEDTVELARPDSSSVTGRVADAAARLAGTEAGRIVLAAIEAHGGLERWYWNGPLHFRYSYERGGNEPPIDTEQIVDTWSSRARHTLMSDTTISFGWTGEEAWTMPDAAELPINARFWSLTPYYFIAMPFVLADPGVNLELAGQTTVEGISYDLVRVTFEPGTGDAPDDYYYILIDPETNRVGGVRYVISYPGRFPDGGNSPETIMLYDGEQQVEGITLQEGFRSFRWTDEGLGEPRAQGSLADVRFEPTAPDSLFQMPVGASVQVEM